MGLRTAKYRDCLVLKVGRDHSPGICFGALGTRFGASGYQVDLKAFGRSHFNSDTNLEHRRFLSS